MAPLLFRRAAWPCAKGRPSRSGALFGSDRVGGDSRVVNDPTFELARRSWKLRSWTWRAMRGRRWTAGGAAYGRRGPFTGDCAELDTRRCQVRHTRAPLQRGERASGPPAPRRSPAFRPASPSWASERRVAPRGEACSRWRGIHVPTAATTARAACASATPSRRRAIAADPVVRDDAADAPGFLRRHASGLQYAGDDRRRPGGATRRGRAAARALVDAPGRGGTIVGERSRSKHRLTDGT